mgnify:CR=1 FL=1
MSAFEVSPIDAKVQKELYRKMIAVNRLDLSSAFNQENKTEQDGFQQQSSVLDNASIFQPRDIMNDDTNPFEQQMARGVYCKISADVKDTDGDIMSLSSFVSGGPGGQEEPSQANRPIAFNKDNFKGNRGETGITGASVSQKSYFVNQITINFTCPDPMDFESRIQPIFLKHGRFILMEFGYGVNEKEFTLMSNIGAKSLSNVNEELMERNLKYPGKYQIYGGQVINYTFSATDYGGYTGTITVLSRGANVLNATTQTGEEGTEVIADKPSLTDYKETLRKQNEKQREDLDKAGKVGDTALETSQKEQQKQFRENSKTFKSMIENLPSVVDTYVLNTETIKEQVKITLDDQNREQQQGVKQLKYKYKNGAMSYWLGSGIQFEPEKLTIISPGIKKAYSVEEIKKAEGFWAKTWEVIEFVGTAVVAAPIAVLDIIGGTIAKGLSATGQALFEAAINDEKYKSKRLVSWGWFEDHILNSFFRVQTEVEGKTIALQELRSVHKPYQYELLNNTEVDKTIQEEVNQTDEITKMEGKKSQVDGLMKVQHGYGGFVNNRCNNNSNIQSVGLHTIMLPGQCAQPSLVGGKLDDNMKTQSIAATEKRIKEEFRVKQVLEAIDKYFPSFARLNRDQSYGYIRNMVFDVKYIQESFKDITSVKDGIRDFWSKVSQDYGGYWNFALAQDLNNDGRMGVVDMNYINPLEKRDDLLSIKQQSDPGNYYDESKLRDKMFFLPIYSKYSIVKDYSINLKLTPKAATLAAYGSNAKTGETESTYHYDLGIERFSTAENAENFGSKEKKKDESKKIFKEGVLVNKLTVPASDNTGTSSDIDETNNFEGQAEELDINFGINFNDVKITTSAKDVDNKIDDKGESKDNPGDEEKESYSSPFKFDKYGRMKTLYQKKMLQLINKSQKKGSGSNYETNKTIIPIELTMTLDGIGGLRPGNMFRVDYLPEIYKKYSYFVITQVGHTIGSGGWTTSVTAIMKLDFPAMLRDGLTKKQEPDNKNETDEETITESQNINEYYKNQKTNDNRRYDQNVINRQRVNKPKIEELRKKGYTITEYEDGTFTATKAIPPQPERPNVPTIAEDDELLDDFAIDNSDPTDENFVGPQIPEQQELDEKTMKKKEADKRGKKKRGGGKGMTGSSGNQQKRKTPEDRKRERKQKEFQEQYNAMTPEQQAEVDKQIAADNAFLESQAANYDDDDL